MQKTVGSWDELMALVYADSWDEKLHRHRAKYVFRGLSNDTYRLVPSLDRIGTHSKAPTIERLLLSDFQQYAHSDASPGASVWNWLAVAQHHGLPTRFLDWTYSPYVALHFVTENLGPNPSHNDGVIWCVNYKLSNRLLPVELKTALEEHRKEVFSVETLNKVVQSLRELDGLSDTPFLFFLEPPSLDPRIVNQAALFSVMSRPEYVHEGVSTTLSLEEFLEQAEIQIGIGVAPVFKKLIVPASLKWEIRDKLDQANITERVMFPGLDGLSAWLRRHYTKRPAEAVSGGT